MVLSGERIFLEKNSLCLHRAFPPNLHLEGTLKRITCAPFMLDGWMAAIQARCRLEGHAATLIRWPAEFATEIYAPKCGDSFVPVH